MIKMGSDVLYITVIFSFFLLLGATLPYINQAFDQNADTYNADTDSITGEIQTSLENDDVSGWTVLLSMTKIFFFTFGDIPVLLDLILFIPRTIFAVLVYRQIRSGGG